MIVPSDLNEIQPRGTQVWNCDEVGFDPNGRWNKVICTSKFFQGERMWKMQNEERAPLWCTLLVFTRGDGQCFVPPIILHQSKEYSQDIHFNLPLYCTVHHTPSGYMNRYSWIKSMTQISNICGASPVINQILFFGGRDIQFDNCALKQIKCRNIQPFVLKIGDKTSTAIPMIMDQMSNRSISAMW